MELVKDAIFALGQVGPAANPAVPILGGVLQVEDRRLRKRAIQALAAIRTPDALRTLAAPLHGDDSELKMQLLRVFQELGPSAAVVRPNLLDAALTESDRLVCDELYLTLGTLGDAILDDLLAFFETLLEDFVRRVLRGLGGRNCKAIINRLSC